MMEDDFMDLSHLLPSAQKIALLPSAERIQHIHTQHWIGYSKAIEAMNKLEELFHWPSSSRMPNLLIISPTNNGKSMIIEKFCRLHPPVMEEDSEKISVVSVQMPSEPSVKRFYTALLAAIGAPIRPRQNVEELERRALSLLRQVQVKILVIDELHNMMAGTDSSQREFLNLLRFLGNELRIPLIGVGTKDAYMAIRSDDQLENRFKPMVLPRWQEGKELESLLASFVTIFPLRRSSAIATPNMARYILTKTEGTIGEIKQFLTSAAIAAIDSGEESINARTLSLTNYEGPTERRHAFERTL